MDIREIDKFYYYDGDDLGMTFENGRYKFKLWSPLSDRVILSIYKDYKDTKASNFEMRKIQHGVFCIEVPLELEGKYYSFTTVIDSVKREFPDPYGRAVSLNGEKTAIIKLENTNPKGFENHFIPKIENKTDAIICEVSVRDISIDSNSKAKNKGKLLALTENQQGDFKDKTMLSHIKDMGFTHVQLMPIYDFASIDETLAVNDESEDNRDYNWGYDPQNYNAVEGSYSTEPSNPTQRIKELKSAIQNIHENGLSVIMDVVYNHVYEQEKSPLHKSMPGYFFRYKDGKLANETGCGNVIASENKMVSKYIVDSVKYWVKEYKLDGFRFDLMGLLDIDTMNKLKLELKKINPDIIIIGEGWDMESILPKDKKAIQKNARFMRDIAFFNDTMRDSLRGSGFISNDKGFLLEDYKKKTNLMKSIVGGINYSKELDLWGDAYPDQVVNYVECHDNHSLYDKLKLENITEDEVKELHRLATTIVLLSQGIPFMQIGQEFFRSKNGVENSYNSPDSINKVNWSDKIKYIDNVEYIKGIIALRKAHELFRMTNVFDIKNNLTFLKTKDSVIAYKLKDEKEELLVVYNIGKERIKLRLLEEKTIEILVEKNQAGNKALKTIKARELEVEGKSTLVAKIN